MLLAEAIALIPRSTPTTGSFIFRQDQQRAKVFFSGTIIVI